jgi:hypothetical protein
VGIRSGAGKSEEASQQHDYEIVAQLLEALLAILVAPIVYKPYYKNQSDLSGDLTA